MLYGRTGYIESEFSLQLDDAEIGVSASTWFGSTTTGFESEQKDVKGHFGGLLIFGFDVESC